MSSAYEADVETVSPYRNIWLEPQRGVEPMFSAWKADVLAVVRLRHNRIFSSPSSDAHPGQFEFTITPPIVYLFAFFEKIISRELLLHAVLVY